MIRFSKYIWLYACISALVLVPGTYSLIRYGLKPSIDFAGGTLVEMRTDKHITADDMGRFAKEAGVGVVSVQQSGDKAYLLRMKQTKPEEMKAISSYIEKKASISANLVRSESVGPVLGKELLKKTMVAAILAVAVILLYVAWAFKNIRFGIAAVVALLHDLLVVLGSFSLFGRYLGVEVDTLFVTAFLTTMSFSVHDTIVVFDRIREYRRRDRSRDFSELCDTSLTETMNRSLTNSFTIMFMLVALILMGGETTRWFVVALFIGTVSGTYSSPFVATPVLLLWDRWEKRRKSR